MIPISIQDLEVLSLKVEVLISRDDVSLDAYELLYMNQLETHQLIELHFAAFSSQDEYDQAWWISNYIIITLLITINSIHESQAS